MASIMDEFISVLEEENKAYEDLAFISRKKTETIVYARVDELMKLTEQEQEIVGSIMNLDKKRLKLREEMAGILKVPVASLTLLNMATILDKRPDEKAKILNLREKIRLTLIEVAKINKENEALLKQSLEMLEYDMNLIRSTRQAPTTANYNKNAYSTDTILPGGGFNVTQ
ncbi:MAG: flagellar protein FlgN [Lachnospiraceae bacterium]|nr:flagellar protein FlgN [Lachnospiraceae bacterium]MBO4461850.1 flagellar protein FlgN [Lachnospiraceae bacterium]MBR5789152.1 flagellar protein FlgN [Lachnospiraceae bacterium]